MALLGRRAPSPSDLAAYVPALRQLDVLRAAGQRIDLSARDTSTTLAATRQSWQATAFAYRAMIGEVREAYRLRSQSVAKCRFYVAQQRPFPEDPVALDSPDHDLDPGLAADALHNFRRLPLDHSPDGFIARADENLNCVGEFWIHADADGSFKVRSVSEVNVAMNGTVTVSTLPGGKAARPLDPETEALLRCWVRDIEWEDLADAPMRSMLDVAEDVVLAGRELRAAARSRVAANGLLLLPAALSLVRSRQDDEDGFDDEVGSDQFMADFTAALLAPLQDDGDAGQVAPVVLRGDAEDLAAVKHLTLERADAERLLDRQNGAILRLLHGLDVQPEEIEGLGSSSHWNAWQIDARSIKVQVQPAADMIAACLMQAYLKPALESLGYSKEDIAQVTIVADASDLAENPNRGQDARDAWDRFGISDEALRRELGFSEDDKPSDEEFIRRMATAGQLPVDVIAKLFGLKSADPQTVDGQVAPAGLPSAEDPVAQPGQITPDQALPSTAADDPTATPTSIPGLVAAGEPDPFAMSVDEDACRQLALIDSMLSERVTVAAHDALARVLDRAGAKVRSAAQRDKTLAAQLVGQEAHLIPSVLGRDQVEALTSVPELVADSHARLHGQFVGWLADAHTQIGEVACRVAGLNPDSERGHSLRRSITQGLAPHVEPAWRLLVDELHDAAEWALFEPASPGDEPEEGEDDGSPLTAQDIADVLAVAGGDRTTLTASADVDGDEVGAFAKGGKGKGGKNWNRKGKKAPKNRKPPTNPGSGVATGPVVDEALAVEGAVLLGYEWDYRDFIGRKQFLPHKLLEGYRFATWTDPILDTGPKTAWLGPRFRPGDHRGCRCSAIRVYAHLDDPEGIVAKRLAEAKGQPQAVANDQLAASDDAAGRVGTSAQQVREIRDRLLAGIDAMRAEHITKPRRRRR